MKWRVTWLLEAYCIIQKSLPNFAWQMGEQSTRNITDPSSVLHSWLQQHFSLAGSTPTHIRGTAWWEDCLGKTLGPGRIHNLEAAPLHTHPVESTRPREAVHAQPVSSLGRGARVSDTESCLAAWWLIFCQLDCSKTHSKTLFLGLWGCFRKRLEFDSRD